VRKVTDYGKLSHQSLDDVKAGARVDVSEKKRFSVDFALWKTSKPGEPSWNGPWGKGRPGWHIECSVMSMKYLGPQFDIHGGAQDLIFPHHENEILQSETASGEKPFVKYWLHAGFLNVGGKKMSKSLGNIIPIGELLEKYSAEELRLFVLSAHYRSPINFTYESLNQARKNLEKLYNLIHNINISIKGQKKEKMDREEEEFYRKLEDLKQKFLEVMDNDFNTPLALRHLFAIMRKTNAYVRSKSDVSKDLLNRFLELFSELGSILGILKEVREVSEELPEELAKLIEEREDARKRKDWETADRIRLHLGELGIILEDTPEGVRWKRKHRKN
jgi:cysteinyl-tRNA synthetase